MRECIPLKFLGMTLNLDRSTYIEVDVIYCRVGLIGIILIYFEKCTHCD